MVLNERYLIVLWLSFHPKKSKTQGKQKNFKLKPRKLQFLELFSPGWKIFEEIFTGVFFLIALIKTFLLIPHLSYLQWTKTAEYVLFHFPVFRWKWIVFDGFRFELGSTTKKNRRHKLYFCLVFYSKNFQVFGRLRRHTVT